MHAWCTSPCPTSMATATPPRQRHSSKPCAVNSTRCPTPRCVGLCVYTLASTALVYCWRGLLTMSVLVTIGVQVNWFKARNFVCPLDLYSPHSVSHPHVAVANLSYCHGTTDAWNTHTHNNNSGSCALPTVCWGGMSASLSAAFAAGKWRGTPSFTTTRVAMRQ